MGNGSSYSTFANEMTFRWEMLQFGAECKIAVNNTQLFNQPECPKGMGF